MINLAIVTPNGNVYSETFIQAHKSVPGTGTYCYYNGFLPKDLEGYGSLLNDSRVERIYYSLKGLLRNQKLSSQGAAVARSFKRKCIQCVLAEYGQTGVAMLSVCQKLRIPLIVHFHGYDASVEHILNRYRDGYRAMFAYASRIVVVSKAMEEKLIGLGCSKDKLVYNPYGPNPSFFSIRPGYENKKLLAIGRFVDKKAPYYTILAFRKTLENHPEAELEMVGDGYLLATCKNLVSSLGISNSVKFSGVLSPIEIQSKFRTSRAFVQHSITAENGDMEGTPVAILEAGAAGLPVIATNHAGIPDVVIHNKTGLLSPEHKVDAMAENMNKILDSAELAAELGTKARFRIREHFTLERHLGILSKCIGDAIKR